MAYCSQCENPNNCFDCADLLAWAPDIETQTYATTDILATDSEICLAPNAKIIGCKGFLMFTGQSRYTYGCERHKLSNCGCGTPKVTIPVNSCAPIDLDAVEIISFCEVNRREVNGVELLCLSGLIRGIKPQSPKCDNGVRSCFDVDPKLIRNHKSNEIVLVNDRRIGKFECLQAYCIEMLYCHQYSGI